MMMLAIILLALVQAVVSAVNVCETYCQQVWESQSVEFNGCASGCAYMLNDGLAHANSERRVIQTIKDGCKRECAADSVSASFEQGCNTGCGYHMKSSFFGTVQNLLDSFFPKSESINKEDRNLEPEYTQPSQQDSHKGRPPTVTWFPHAWRKTANDWLGGSGWQKIGDLMNRQKSSEWFQQIKPIAISWKEKLPANGDLTKHLNNIWSSFGNANHQNSKATSLRKEVDKLLKNAKNIFKAHFDPQLRVQESSPSDEQYADGGNHISKIISFKTLGEDFPQIPVDEEGDGIPVSTGNETIDFFDDSWLSYLQKRTHSFSTSTRWILLCATIACIISMIWICAMIIRSLASCRAPNRYCCCAGRQSRLRASKQTGGVYLEDDGTKRPLIASGADTADGYGAPPPYIAADGQTCSSVEEA